MVGYFFHGIVNLFIHFFYGLFVLLEDQGLPEEVLSIKKKESTSDNEFSDMPHLLNLTCGMEENKLNFI